MILVTGHLLNLEREITEKVTVDVQCICTLSNVFKNIYDEIYIHDEKHNLCSCHDKIGSLFLFFLRKILKIRERRIDLLIYLPNLFKLL